MEYDTTTGFIRKVIAMENTTEEKAMFSPVSSQLTLAAFPFCESNEFGVDFQAGKYSERHTLPLQEKIEVAKYGSGGDLRSIDETKNHLHLASQIRTANEAVSVLLRTVKNHEENADVRKCLGSQWGLHPTYLTQDVVRAESLIDALKQPKISILELATELYEKSGYRKAVEDGLIPAPKLVCIGGTTPMSLIDKKGIEDNNLFKDVVFQESLHVDLEEKILLVFVQEELGHPASFGYSSSAPTEIEHEEHSVFGPSYSWRARSRIDVINSIIGKIEIKNNPS